MRFISIPIAIVLGLILSACNGVDRYVNEARKGVVAIEVLKFIDGSPAAGIGSGFFVDTNEIVTNKHVVENATTIMIRTNVAEEAYEAEVVHADAMTDLAIIRLKDIKAFRKDNSYNILKLAGSNEFEVTQEVYAIGHPWSMGWSISRGILSAVDRKMDEGPRYLFQVDAHVYEGNSGGPLVDDYGKVIGVNSAMIARTGGSYGMVLPVAILRKVLHDLEEYGEVRWAYLGIGITGSTIKGITPGGPADKAGLKIDDKLLTYETDSGTFSPNERVLPILMAVHSPKRVVEVTVERAGKPLTLRVKPDWKSSGELEKLFASP